MKPPRWVNSFIPMPIHLVNPHNMTFLDRQTGSTVRASRRPGPFCPPILQASCDRKQLSDESRLRLFFVMLSFVLCVAPLFPEELWTAPGSGCRLSVFLHAGSQQLGRCLERASGAMLGFLTFFNWEPRPGDVEGASDIREQHPGF